MLIRDVRKDDDLELRPPREPDFAIRRELRSGDVEAIEELHRRIYSAEYQRNERFVADVRAALDVAVAAGWPERSGAVWLVEGGGALRGCTALTEEGDGLGKIRWVVLEPQLRGIGLGRRLIGAAVEAARDAGLRRLELHTFSDLRDAARIYRSFGLRVVDSEPRESWGPPITYQRYARDL